MKYAFLFGFVVSVLAASAFAADGPFVETKVLMLRINSFNQALVGFTVDGKNMEVSVCRNAEGGGAMLVQALSFAYITRATVGLSIGTEMRRNNAVPCIQEIVLHR